MKTTIAAFAFSLVLAGFAFADNGAPASSPGVTKPNPCRDLNEKVVEACKAAGYKLGAAKDKAYLDGKGGLFRNCVMPIEKLGKWPTRLPKDALAKADLKACRPLWKSAGKNAKKAAQPTGAAASTPAATSAPSAGGGQK